MHGYVMMRGWISYNSIIMPGNFAISWIPWDCLPVHGLLAMISM